MAKTYGDAFPDAKMELKPLYTHGEIAIAEFSVQGTHAGQLMDIAPTSKRVGCALCNVIELCDGKIYRERDYFDPLSILSQIGAVPAMSATA